MSNINLRKEVRGLYQGRFHYHSLEVGGELPLEKVVERYKHQCGYDFITLLDCPMFDEQGFFEDDNDFL